MQVAFQFDYHHGATKKMEVRDLWSTTMIWMDHIKCLKVSDQIFDFEYQLDASSMISDVSVYTLEVRDPHHSELLMMFLHNGST